MKPFNKEEATNENVRFRGDDVKLGEYHLYETGDDDWPIYATDINRRKGFNLRKDGKMFSDPRIESKYDLMIEEEEIEVYINVYKYKGRLIFSNVCLTQESAASVRENTSDLKFIRTINFKFKI